VVSNTDPRVWPYYFCTTLIAVLGSTALVLAGSTTLAIAWTLNFSVIGIVMWLVQSVTAAALPRYEWLGVRTFSRLIAVRRSPRVRLEGGRNGLGVLDARSRAAEMSHGLIFLVLACAAGICAVIGELRVAAWTTLLNTIFNGYPVLLQRYTRARLLRLRTRALRHP
jgi:hypothetical protein